jgi:uncharacterized membrane protein YbhN (UPF0104 family)
MDWLKSLVANRRVRRIVALVILIATVIVFVQFFARHSEHLDTIRHIQAWVVLAIIGFNIGVVVSLVFIYNFALELIGKRLSLKEQFLLTAYSSIANFFGPLQSGPGLRTIYLKAKHKIRVRDYILVTMVYYGIFTSLSALFLFGGSRPWWQALLLFIAVAFAAYWAVQWFSHRGSVRSFQPNPKVLGGLLIAVFFQLCFITGYYFVELRAINPHVSLSQAISYSGAANFALFVALTPDAIGIRETFLLLSTKLHHISTADIISANLIDRVVYALFLGLLFLLILSLHSGTKIKQFQQLRRKADD